MKYLFWKSLVYFDNIILRYVDYFINDFTTLSTYNKSWVFLIDGCIKICVYLMML